MKRVYLSGPITGCTYQGCTDWRKGAAAALRKHGVICDSPLRGKDFLEGLGAITDKLASDTGNALTQDNGIVSRDRYDTVRADFLLVNLLGADRVSIGTMVELGWADLARVPIVLVMEPAGNIHEHCFVRQLAAYRVATLEAGVAVIASALGRPA